MSNLYCPNCGKKSQDPSAKFCFNCGNSFKKTIPPVAEESNISRVQPRRFPGFPKSSVRASVATEDTEDGVSLQEFNVELSQLEYEANFDRNVTPQTLGSAMSNPTKYVPREKVKGKKVSNEEFLNEFKAEAGFFDKEKRTIADE